MAWEPDLAIRVPMATYTCNLYVIFACYIFSNLSYVLCAILFRGCKINASLFLLLPIMSVCPKQMYPYSN